MVWESRPNSELRQEDYVIHSLVPYIDENFPTRTDKEARWLIGFSKSALGALTLLLRNPEVFGYAAGWDGPFMLDGKNSSEDWGPMGLSANFGTLETMQKNLPTKLAEENAPRLRMRPHIALGLRIFWAGQTKAMRAHLKRLGIPHIYRSDLTFPHRWDSGWFTPLADELIRMTEAPAAKP